MVSFPSEKVPASWRSSPASASRSASAKSSAELWKRLRFLLRSLDAPAAEVDAFVDDFRGWLERMEYVQLDEFRSELQYRLTLALDMEDEEDERSRLFLKISEGLSRTREQFSRRLDSLFSSHGELNESFWEELEELFIMADLGYEPSLELVERLRERARKENVTRVEDVRGLLMAEVDEIFRLPRRISAVNPPEVVLQPVPVSAGVYHHHAVRPLRCARQVRAQKRDTRPGPRRFLLRRHLLH